MEPAFKRKPDAKMETQETGNRTLKTFKPGPEGPTVHVMRIPVSPQHFDVLSKSKFLRLDIGSGDGRFAVAAILKNSGSFLQPVPMRIPPIGVTMEPGMFRESIDHATVFRVEDGHGRHMDYSLASLRPVAVLDDGKGPRRKAYTQ